jgi:hypothetical protein
VTKLYCYSCDEPIEEGERVVETDKHLFHYECFMDGHSDDVLSRLDLYMETAEVGKEYPQKCDNCGTLILPEELIDDDKEYQDDELYPQSKYTEVDGKVCCELCWQEEYKELISDSIAVYYNEPDDDYDPSDKDDW